MAPSTLSLQMPQLAILLLARVCDVATAGSPTGVTDVAICVHALPEAIEYYFVGACLQLSPLLRLMNQSPVRCEHALPGLR
jgi:hypothetical protein